MDARHDSDAYLKQFHAHQENHTVETSNNFFDKVDFGGGKLTFGDDRHLGGGIETDLATGDNTAFVEADVDVRAAFGIGGSADDAVKAGLTFDADGNPKGLALSGSLDLAGDTKALAGFGAPSLEPGMTTAWHADLDLADDGNRREAYAYVQAVQQGDAAGATTHLARLLDRSQVVVTTSEAVTTGRTVDLGLGSTSTTTSRTTTKDVLIRLPGGGWKHYQAS